MLVFCEAHHARWPLFLPGLRCCASWCVTHCCKLATATAFGAASLLAVLYTLSRCAQHHECSCNSTAGSVAKDDERHLGGLQNSPSQPHPALPSCPLHCKGQITAWRAHTSLLAGSSAGGLGHTSTVWGVAFNASGSHMVSCSDDCTLKVGTFLLPSLLLMSGWDAVNRRCLLLCVLVWWPVECRLTKASILVPADSRALPAGEQALSSLPRSLML